MSARDVLLSIDVLAHAFLDAVAVSGDNGAGRVCRTQSGSTISYEIDRDDLVFGKDVVEQLIRAGWEFTPPAAPTP